MTVLMVKVIIAMLIAIVIISISSSITGTFLKRVVFSVLGLMRFEIETAQKEKAGVGAPANSKEPDK